MSKQTEQSLNKKKNSETNKLTNDDFLDMEPGVKYKPACIN